MDTICGIYMIKNIVNGKVYIGQSVDIYTRWYNHKRDLSNGVHYNTHLQKSWNKYGESSFEFSIIKTCDQNDLDLLEVKYISLYNSCDSKFGYNMSFGGAGGGIPNDKVRVKLSIANTGENNPMFGKHHTTETKKKISEAKTGYKAPWARAVYCPELDKAFRCATDASKECGIAYSSISMCLNGKRKSAGKHPITGEPLHWLYVDELEVAS